MNITKFMDSNNGACGTPRPIFWSLSAGFLAASLNEAFSYGLVQPTCAHGHQIVMHMITFACFAIALSGFVVGWIEFRALPEDTSEEGGTWRDRAHFQALLGMAFSLAFAVVIAALAVPQWLLDPCAS
jgi:hypothetical protein